MKAFKLFSMAAVALVMAACSNDEIEQTQQPTSEAGKVYFKATIGPTTSDVTRTVISPGTGTNAGTLVVAWKGGEEIALIHNGAKDKVTVKTVNPDGSAVVSGSITALGAEGEAAKLVYPYGAVDWVTSGTNYIANTDEEFLALGYAQDGTLAYIGDNDLEGRVGTGILKTVDGNVTIKKSATEDNVVMESRAAIWELNLTTDGTTPFNATKVTLKLGIEGMLKIAETATLTTGQSQFFLCVVPEVIDEYGSDIFTIEATDGTDTYAYKKTTPLILENGKYYQSTVTLTKLITLNINNPTIGQVIGDNGVNYDYASLPSGVTAVAKICDVYGGKYGLALALADEASTMDFSTAFTTAAVHTPWFFGGYWSTPESNQWEYMVDAAGGYESLRDGFESVGGTNMLPGLYWACNSVHETSAWIYNFDSGFEGTQSKTTNLRVRALLSFTY